MGNGAVVGSSPRSKADHDGYLYLDRFDSFSSNNKNQDYTIKMNPRSDDALNEWEKKDHNLHSSSKMNTNFSTPERHHSTMTVQTLTKQEDCAILYRHVSATASKSATPVSSLESEGRLSNSTPLSGRISKRSDILLGHDIQSSHCIDSASIHHPYTFPGNQKALNKEAPMYNYVSENKEIAQLIVEVEALAEAISDQCREDLSPTKRWDVKQTKLSEAYDDKVTGFGATIKQALSVLYRCCVLCNYP